MNRKRKRTDPKPIWAVREDEIFEGKTLQQHLNERQPPPAPPQQHARPPPQSQPPPGALRNGHAQPPPASGPHPAQSAKLGGYERPISDDGRVYDEVQRRVCDFLFTNVILNEKVRGVLREAPDTMVEVEARWGQIMRRDTDQRLIGDHLTECVIRPAVTHSHTTFQSTMTVEQHRKMNQYLNKQVKPEGTPNRPAINYKHTRVVDQQYELDDAAMARLSPAAQDVIRSDGKRARIRVSRDQKTGEVLAAIIKHKVINLEISSPQTEWDYRIGINMEIAFPGPLEGLTPSVEKGKSVDAMKRHKDRMSYSYLGAFQIDLTQVTQDNVKIHELELELNPNLLLEHGDRVRVGQPSEFESLVNGMINNLRVLSREVTPVKKSI